MKKNLILLALVIFSMSAFAQKEDSVINVSNDIQLIKIKDNIYLSKSFAEVEGYGLVDANGMVLIDEEMIVMINTPWNDKQMSEICDFLEKKFNKKVEHLIVTHSHSDCMGGFNEALKRKIVTYTLDKTVGIASKIEKKVFDVVFSDELPLKFKTHELEIYYPGGGHTIDNTVVWLKKDNILYAGCLVKEVSSKNLGNVSEADVKGYPKTLKNVLKKYPNAKIVIPGHGNYGGLELVNHSLELTKKLKK